MEKIKYQQGVSLFEFILVIAIVGVITTIIMNQVNEYFKKEKSQQYGHQSIILAKAFSRYITDHYKQYYDSSKINTQHIKYKELSDANYLPIGMKNQKNIYGYTPCISIIHDNDLNSIQAVMFFTTSESNIKITFRDGADAMMAAGIAAGVIDTDKKQVYGSGRAWKIDNSNGNDYDSYFKTGGCDYSQIPANSLVINLSLLSDYILQQHNESQIDTDKYLYRIPDDNYNCPVGKDCNRNTMKADIIMNSQGSDGIVKYHSINFGYGSAIDTGPILTSGNNNDDISKRQAKALSNEVVLAGGGFAANTLRPMLYKNQYESCSLVELGTIVKEESSTDNPILIRNQLLCSYSPVCPSNTNYYCYLPISDMTITYNLKDTQTFFSCPNGSYIDVTTPFLVMIDGKTIDSKNDQVTPNFSDAQDLRSFVIYKSLAPTVYGRPASIVSITCTSNPALIRK